MEKNKKQKEIKILVLILIILLLLVTIVCLYLLKDKKIELLYDYEYFIDDENQIISLTKYKGKDINLNIPATVRIDYKTYKVLLYTDETLKASAFSNNTNIHSIAIEEGVLANGMSYMFKGCTNLRYIDGFPNYTGQNWISVFEGCKNLISAPQIPKDIKNIKIESFYSGCKNLIGEYVLPKEYDINYSSNVFKDCISINKNTNIAWFGDSITSGTHTSGVSFVTYLSSDLNDTGIANYAVGGHTLSYGYDKNETGIEKSIITDINKMGYHPNIDYVFISAGTNDFGKTSSRRPLGEYRFADIGKIYDTNPSTIIGAINTIYELVCNKFPNAELIFITPITRGVCDVEGAKATDGTVFKVHLKDYVEAIKIACNLKGIKYIDAYTESNLEVTKDSCDGLQNYLPDKLHLTLSGQKVLEEYILNKLVTEYGFRKNN